MYVCISRTTWYSLVILKQTGSLAALFTHLKNLWDDKDEGQRKRDLFFRHWKALSLRS